MSVLLGGIKELENFLNEFPIPSASVNFFCLSLVGNGLTLAFKLALYSIDFADIYS
jgi:hypothetical protein